MIYKDLKEQVFQANMRIPQNSLAILTWGNVSAIDRELGVFAIKPSGVDYDILKVDDIVVLDLEGNIVEGSLKPSSDTNTHLVLYNNFSEINAITHTHSPYAVAWAQAKMPIPIFGTTHADFLTGDIPIAEEMSDDAIKNDYEIETGNQIVSAMQNKDASEVEMILVACHGPFTWGKSVSKAVENAMALEEIAKMAYITATINTKADRLKQTLIDKHYYRKHGKNAYYGQ